MIANNMLLVKYEFLSWVAISVAGVILIRLQVTVHSDFTRVVACQAMRKLPSRPVDFVES
jgi:hypothetical protein